MKKISSIAHPSPRSQPLRCGSGDTQESAERSVTITLPRTLFGTQSDDQIQETAQAEDITATITDDTVTYQMTPETQQELLLGFKTHLKRSTEHIDSGDIPGLVHVDYNDTMSAFTVTVNRDNFQTQGAKPSSASSIPPAPPTSLRRHRRRSHRRHRYPRRSSHPGRI